MSKRYKHVDDLTPDEMYAFMTTGEIPELMDPDEEESLRAAGYDPESKRPLVDVEAEREAERERQQAREDEIADAEAMPMEDIVKQQQERNEPHNGRLGDKRLSGKEPHR